MRDVISTSMVRIDDKQPTLPRHVAFIMDGNGRWLRNADYLVLPDIEPVWNPCARQSVTH